MLCRCCRGVSKDIQCLIAFVTAQILLTFILVYSTVALVNITTNKPDYKYDNYSFSPLVGDLYPRGFTYSNAKLCPDFGTNIQVVVMVITEPKRISERIAIRNTWGTECKLPEIAMAFVIGAITDDNMENLIQAETHIYDDIIRCSFIDSYDNLTLKSMCILEWVTTYCSRSLFALKTDDDMFINVPMLLNFVSKLNPKRRQIYGQISDRHYVPIRDKKSKYYISEEEYFLDRYPSFATGPAYVYPVQMSAELLNASFGRQFLKLEDVFVTGIVANKLGIKHKKEFKFLNRRLMSCSILKSFVSKREYILNSFPIYANGPAYLLPNNITGEIYEAGLKQRYLKLEDVFITGLLPQALGIDRCKARSLLTYRVRMSHCHVRKLMGVNINITQIYGIWYVMVNKHVNCLKIRDGKTVKHGVGFKYQNLLDQEFKKYFTSAGP